MSRWSLLKQKDDDNRRLEQGNTSESRRQVLLHRSLTDQRIKHPSIVYRKIISRALQIVAHSKFRQLESRRHPWLCQPLAWIIGRGLSWPAVGDWSRGSAQKKSCKSSQKRLQHSNRMLQYGLIQALFIHVITMRIRRLSSTATWKHILSLPWRTTAAHRQFQYPFLAKSKLFNFPFRLMEGVTAHPSTISSERCHQLCRPKPNRVWVHDKRFVLKVR